MKYSMMSDYSIENSKLDSFYTMDDSEFDNKIKSETNYKEISEKNKLNKKLQEYHKIVKRAHLDFIGGRLFEDNIFPAINANLFENSENMKIVIDEIKNISWVRPHSINTNPIFFHSLSNLIIFRFA